MKEDLGVVYLYVYINGKDNRTEERIRFSVKEYLKDLSKGELEQAPHFDKEINVGRTSRGKPYIENMMDIGISVSHSADHLVCAVGKGELGVDVERPKSLKNESPEEMKKRLTGIAERFFNPSEAEYVKLDPVNNFYKVWTAKESYVKLLGKGIDETFSDNCVVSQDFHRAYSEKSEFVKWKAEEIYFSQRVLVSEYYLCICSREPVDVKVIYLKEV